MKSKYLFQTMELDDEIMAIPVGDNAGALHGVLRINETAAAILKLLEQDISEEQIVAELRKEYSGDEREIQEYVHEYISTLLNEGIVE